MNTEEFVAKALEVHPDNSTFNYDGVQYHGPDIKVNITCSNCGGSYCKTPRLHLRGNACPLCYDPQVLKFQKTKTLEIYWV